MARAGDVEIPYDATGEAAPSWRCFRPYTPDGAPEDPRRGVLLTCACGACACLRSITVRDDGTFGHRVDADGTVSPSIVCPHGCKWHVWGRLLWARLAGWDPAWAP